MYVENFISGYIYKDGRYSAQNASTFQGVTTYSLLSPKSIFLPSTGSPEIMPSIDTPEAVMTPQPIEDPKHATSDKVNVNVDVEKDTIAEEKAVHGALEKHAHDQDEAMKAVDEMNGELVEVDEQTSKRLLRTIDRHLMPIMCMVYAMNYLDKTSLSYASVMGIQKDIHLTKSNYSWLGKCRCFRQEKES